MNLLGTTELSFEIEKIICEAEEFIIIISPYLKINNRLKLKMSDCFNRCRNNLIAYREKDLKENEYSWLKNHKNLQIFLIKNLHAKCYVNEKSAIITSMNLHDYSQINNHELGVQFDPEDDRDNFIKLMKEIRLIINSEYPTFDLSDYIDNYLDFSIRKLFRELIEHYNFDFGNINYDEKYFYICKIATTLHKFNDDELYLDKSAILRSTELGKELYNKLFSEISKFGRKK